MSSYLDRIWEKWACLQPGRVLKERSARRLLLRRPRSVEGVAELEDRTHAQRFLGAGAATLSRFSHARVCHLKLHLKLCSIDRRGPTE